MKLYIVLLLNIYFKTSNSEILVDINPVNGGLAFAASYNGDVKIRGQFGHFPWVVQSENCGDGCYKYSDFANITFNEYTNDCLTVEWLADYAKEIRDCFLIENHWYGGGETYRQHWPIEGENRPEAPFVTADSYGNRDSDFGGVSERYWLVSSGVGIHIGENIPLFVSTNTVRENHFCIAAKNGSPYQKRSVLTLRYDLCFASNLKEAHSKIHGMFFEGPTELPDEGMLLKPFWSTWAEYKENVNESIVIDYAATIIENGFTDNSHVEIDDNWETCYGEAEFNTDKFPDVAGMVTQIKEMGYRVTLWIHPFINFQCPSFSHALTERYLVLTEKGLTGITSWWQGTNAGIVDFTNPAAVEWWIPRLEKLRNDFGIDSFKFDAGETNWLPHSSLFSTEPELQPNIYSEKFAEAMSRFGGLIEVRTVKKSQSLPIFVRMLDKDSNWGYGNGLKSLIPTLLHFGLQGYPFVLPDMIGGNGYTGEGGLPSRELYIRWMQANIFMPAVQFSIVPWNYDAEVVEITKRVLDIRRQHEDEILTAARLALTGAVPINRPLWWADPEDPNTYTIDDEYLLGDRILVAPVLEQNANSRNIYLPTGNWLGFNNVTYTGPILLSDFPADIYTVPYFFKN